MKEGLSLIDQARQRYVEFSDPDFVAKLNSPEIDWQILERRIETKHLLGGGLDWLGDQDEDEIFGPISIHEINCADCELTGEYVARLGVQMMMNIKHNGMRVKYDPNKIRSKYAEPVESKQTRPLDTDELKKVIAQIASVTEETILE